MFDTPGVRPPVYLGRHDFDQIIPGLNAVGRKRFEEVEADQIEHLQLLDCSGLDAVGVLGILDVWEFSDLRLNSIELLAAAEPRQDAQELVSLFRDRETLIGKDHLAFVTAAAVAWRVPGCEHGVNDHVVRILRRLVEHDLAGAEEVDAEPPGDGFATVRRWAAANLKGDERSVVEALCDHGGEVRFVEMEHIEGLEWNSGVDGNARRFGQVARRIQNQTLPGSKRLNAKSRAWKALNWRLCRRGNAAVLKKLAPGVGADG